MLFGGKNVDVLLIPKEQMKILLLVISKEIFQMLENPKKKFKSLEKLILNVF